MTLGVTCRDFSLPYHKKVITLTRKKLIIAFCVMLLCAFCAVHACRYTIRDVGFVDVVSEYYSLYLYIDNETPQDLQTALNEVSYASLLETNVKAFVIHVGENKSHPATRYIEQWGVKEFPAAILVSPKGRSQVLELPLSDTNPKASLGTFFEGVASSPKRQELLENIIANFCVVLLIEGKDAEKNSRAHKEATGAIADVTKVLGDMDKPYEKPPQLVVIPEEDLAQEKVLLWSLGLASEEIDEPYVAILYGKGRKFGPILSGEKIRRASVFRILATVGVDCECGLDRSWMTDMRIPLKWSKNSQAEAALTLGFDPENPMVKTEVSQILLLGKSSLRSQNTLSDGSNNTLPTYREEVVTSEKATSLMIIPENKSRIESSVSRQSGTSTAATSQRFLFSFTIAIIAGFGALVIGVGLAIVFIARGRNA